jgi:2-hydroxymuconate-semialdehyde hydrolase
MRKLLDIFAFDRGLVTDELARAALRRQHPAGISGSFFVDVPRTASALGGSLASPEADIRALPHETLIMHGREDQGDSFVKLAPAERAAGFHVRSCMCLAAAVTGRRLSTRHAFAQLVGNFLAEEDAWAA